jgi:hypothetical protein
VSDKEVNSALNLINRKVQLVLDETAQKIVDLAKDLCVVGQYSSGQVGGRLRGSISWSDESHVEMYEQSGSGTGSTTQDKINRAPNKDTRYIGTNVDYAAHVEFGTGEFAEGGGRQGGWSYKDDAGVWHFTKGAHPRPFLRPALKQARRIFKQVAKRHGVKGSIK